MDYPKIIVSNQKEESISIQGFKYDIYILIMEFHGQSSQKPLLSISAAHPFNTCTNTLQL